VRGLPVNRERIRATLIPGVLTLEGRIVSIIAIPAIVDQSWETMSEAA